MNTDAPIADSDLSALHVEALRLSAGAYPSWEHYMAKLASIEDLDVFSPLERLTLRHAAGRLAGTPGQPIRHDQLVQGNRAARFAIYALLGGLEYAPQDIEQSAWPVFRLDGWRVKTRSEPLGKRIDLALVLFRLLREFAEKARPFPFGECAYAKCSQRIFVRNGRQRYCSPVCKYNAEHDDRQRDRETYNKYMKELQAEHRAGKRRRRPTKSASVDAGARGKVRPKKPRKKR